MKSNIKIKSNMTEAEKSNRERLVGLFRGCPIPDNELLSNLSLFLTRQNLSSLLFMIELYKKIVDVHGVIFEFGVRWGRNLALYESLRGIFEPFNHNRKIIGFDTFEGFPSVDKKDGDAEIIAPGSYGVTRDYDEYLTEVLNCHERESPISNIRKYQLIKGDAAVEIEKYFRDYPETIVAFAYFDFDIYQPTKKCLEAVRGHLTKGSVIGFDELNHRDYPGETLALKEVLGLDAYKIQRNTFSPTQSYIVIE